MDTSTAEGKVIDLDTVCSLLKAQGFEAIVEQTGGGVATVYVGDRVAVEEPTFGYREDGNGPRLVQIGTQIVDRYAAVAGPGWFEGPGWSAPKADVSDFCIGADDDGEGAVTYAEADWTEAKVVEAIVAQVIKS